MRGIQLYSGGRCLAGAAVPPVRCTCRRQICRYEIQDRMCYAPIALFYE